jgi:hypothetical protein
MTLESSSKKSLHDEPAKPGPAQLSLGAGMAIVGVCLVAALLIVFLCILVFTDLLVGDTGTASDYKPSGFDLLFVLAFTLSPGVVAYWICKMILNKE